MIRRRKEEASPSQLGNHMFPLIGGGLGIRPINIVNWAFIAKLLWKLLSEPDCLWTWVMKHKYFPKESALTIQVKPTDSFAWKARPSFFRGLADALLCLSSYSSLDWTFVSVPSSIFN